MSQVFSYPDFFSVLLVMVVAGIVGGVVNHFYVPLSGPAPQPTPPVPIPTDGTPSVPAAPVVPTPSMSSRESLSQSIVVGIGASLLIPVFLFLTQSKVWDTLINPVMPTDTTEAVKARPVTSRTTSQDTDSSSSSKDTARVDRATNQNTRNLATGPPPPGFVTLPEKVNAYLVFFSFCLIAAISGFRFISSISERAFADLKNKVEENKKETDTKVALVNTKAAEASVKANDAEIKVQQATTETQQAVAANAESQRAVNRELIRKANAIPAANTLPAPQGATMQSLNMKVSTDRDTLIRERLTQKGQQADDTQKGRWGGSPESAHYRLQTTVEPIDQKGCYCAVTFWVEAKDPATHPLTGDVVFLLDSTFAEPQLTVPVDNDGKATLKRLMAWGVFTAGAVTQDCETLELDLANVGNLPECFRNATTPPTLTANA